MYVTAAKVLPQTCLLISCIRDCRLVLTKCCRLAKGSMVRRLLGAKQLSLPAWCRIAAMYEIAELTVNIPMCAGARPKKQFIYFTLISVTSPKAFTMGNVLKSRFLP